MSSAEINQVLANSLSPDATLRSAAEQQLTQAAESNFSHAHRSLQPLYLATLVQELANEQAEGSIRAAAGIALKNAFTTRDFARHQELQAKWLQQTDNETKTRVKELTLQTLASSNAQAYTGEGYGAPGWETVQRHHHPTRLSDVIEEDERSRASTQMSRF
ncbi:hypothetical protein NQ176_g4819 [Zarea fungicola]|uniref:Uncharacterized protein n=1 Tax=Zarea fungicola TaxID=93591 RepID=A0ACC1NBK7_9HYPO|nr:hypothetical protein NQ176_g4819 [Lecanicillium fungicola]